jgi:hypothetical protein
MRGLLLVFACVVFFSATPVWAQAQGAETELTAAVIIEQNITFAVVLVKSSTLDDKNFADGLIKTLEPSFGGVPVVLMVQDENGTPSYYGRPDIAEFLSKTPLESMPWKKYALRQVSK